LKHLDARPREEDEEIQRRVKRLGALSPPAVGVGVGDVAITSLLSCDMVGMDDRGDLRVAFDGVNNGFTT
jgi:hypothetical protein